MNHDAESARYIKRRKERVQRDFSRNDLKPSAWDDKLQASGIRLRVPFS
jgi:hypothetical protein